MESRIDSRVRLTDAGIALRPEAHAFGLGFTAAGRSGFDLVIAAAHAGHPTVRVMLDVLTRRTFWRELAALPGYEVSYARSTVMLLKAA